MTYAELLQKIDSVMATIEASIGAQANVPIQTGRLRSAIKVRKSADGYEIYVDDGGLSVEQWQEMYPGFSADITDNPVGVAPYASEVNDRTQYWRRVAFAIRDRLNVALGGDFQTEYDKRGGK